MDDYQQSKREIANTEYPQGGLVMKIMTKKIAWIALALMLVTSVSTGCGNPGGISGTGSQSGQENGQKSVITFAGWGSLAEKKIFTQMIGKFTEKYPDIKVNYQHVPGTQDDYMVKLSSNLAASKMPDVFYVHSDDFYAWVSAGRLLNLSDFLSTSKEYVKGKVWDKSISIFQYNTETKKVGTDGGLYGLPKDLGPWAMVYNKTLFQKKGVALPDPVKPMTWSDFVETAKKLTGGEGLEKIFGTANYTLESAVWSNGADFLNSDKNQVTVDTPKFAEAMQWVADLSLKEGVSPSPDEDAASGWFQRWINGKVGMAWMGPWDQATFWDTAKFEWDIMPTPASPSTGKGISWLASAALCVSTTSKYQDASYKLAEFLSMNDEAQTFNFTSGQAVPNIIDMAKNQYLSMNKAPANKQIFIDIIENPEKGQFKPTYYTSDNTWYTYFFSESTKVWNGTMSAADFCKQIQPEMQKRLNGK